MIDIDSKCAAPPDDKPDKMGLENFLVADGPGKLPGEPEPDWLNAGGDRDQLAPKAKKTTGAGPRMEAKEIDPMMAAQKFLTASTIDEMHTLRYWRGGHWQWRDGAYRDISPSDVRGQLINSLNEEYRKLSSGVTGNVMDQVRAIGRIPGHVEPPAWLPSTLPNAPPDPWPADEILVARNGLVHLPSLIASETCTTAPTPRLFTTSALDYDFDPEAPRPSAWLDFLASLWPDDPMSIMTLQEWFGYCLTGDTRQQKMLLLVGPKRSGKGTIARVLRAMIGPANVAGPTLASLSGNFGLWPLLGKSLAIISDARLSGRTDQAVVTERLLSISGEDALTVDRKFSEPVTCKLPSRLMVLSNELPRLSDSSGALVGRMIVLRLTRSFFGQEDLDLTDRLLGELPGILLWAVAGWERLRQRRHFIQPDAALEMLSDMADLSSPIGAFIRDCCVVGPAYHVSLDTIYDAWCQWCEANGRREAGVRHVFGRDLSAAIPTLGRGHPRGRDGDSRYTAYSGVGLKASR